MSPTSSAASARDRVLDAATDEFARYGIAGARIDRIAKSAKTSKERVYAYFRSKEQLYAVIAAKELDAVAAATHLDPADLPGYAGRVHDYFVANPGNLRLIRWGQLEFSGAGADAAARATVEPKVDKLRRAQLEGLLTRAWDPLDILVFVNQLAMAWGEQPGLIPAETGARERFLAERRAAVVAAVERLFPVVGPRSGAEFASSEP